MFSIYESRNDHALRASVTSSGFIENPELIVFLPKQINVSQRLSELIKRELSNGKFAEIAGSPPSKDSEKIEVKPHEFSTSEFINSLSKLEFIRMANVLKEVSKFPSSDAAIFLNEMRRNQLIPKSARVSIEVLARVSPSPIDYVSQVSENLDENLFSQIPNYSNRIEMFNIIEFWKNNDENEKRSRKLRFLNILIKNLVTERPEVVKITSVNNTAIKKKITAHSRRSGESGIEVFASSKTSQEVPLIIFSDANSDASSRENFDISRAHFESLFTVNLSKSNDLGSKPRHFFKAYSPSGSDVRVVPESVIFAPSSESISSLRIGSFQTTLRIGKETINIRLAYSDNVYTILQPDESTVDENEILAILSRAFPTLDFITGGIGRIVGNFSIIGDTTLKISPDIFYILTIIETNFRNFIFMNETVSSYADKHGAAVFNFTKNFNGFSENDDGGITSPVSFNFGKSIEVIDREDGLSVKVYYSAIDEYSLSVFMAALSHLMKIYDNLADANKEFATKRLGAKSCCSYPSRLRGVSKSTGATPIDKLLDLKANSASGTIKSGYAVNCQCPNQPVIIGKDEVNEWVGDDQDRVLDSNGRLYVCPSAKYQYPIMNTKKNTDPYPCCFANLQDRGGQREIQARSDYLISRISILDQGRLGKVPQTVDRILQAAFRTGVSPRQNFVRVGVSKTNSFIRATMIAALSKNGSEISASIDAITDDAVNEIRQRMFNLDPAVYAQEFFDASPTGGSMRSKTISDMVKSSFNHPLQSYIHFRGLEEILNVNIFVFSRNDTPLNSPGTVIKSLTLSDYEIEIPRSAIAHFRPSIKPTKTVILMSFADSNTGIHYYEPIVSRGTEVNEQTGAYGKLPDVIPNTVFALNRQSGESIRNVLVSKIGARIPGANNDYAASSGDDPISQHVDMFGKARAVRFADRVVKFPPCRPLMIPISEETACVSPNLLPEPEKNSVYEIYSADWAKAPDEVLRPIILRDARRTTNVFVQFIIWSMIISRISTRSPERKFDTDKWWNGIVKISPGEALKFPRIPRNTFPKIDMSTLSHNSSVSSGKEAVKALSKLWPSTFCKDGFIRVTSAPDGGNPEKFLNDVKAFISRINESTDDIENVTDAVDKIIPNIFLGVLESPTDLGSSSETAVFTNLEQFNAWSSGCVATCDLVPTNPNTTVFNTNARVVSENGPGGFWGDLNDHLPFFGGLKVIIKPNPASFMDYGVIASSSTISTIIESEESSSLTLPNKLIVRNANAGIFGERESGDYGVLGMNNGVFEGFSGENAFAIEIENGVFVNFTGTGVN